MVDWSYFLLDVVWTKTLRTGNVTRKNINSKNKFINKENTKLILFIKENVILKATNVNFPGKPNVSSEAKEVIKHCLTYDQELRWDINQLYFSNYIS